MSCKALLITCPICKIVESTDCTGIPECGEEKPKSCDRLSPSTQIELLLALSRVVSPKWRHHDLKHIFSHLWLQTRTADAPGGMHGKAERNSKRSYNHAIETHKGIRMKVFHITSRRTCDLSLLLGTAQVKKPITSYNSCNPNSSITCRQQHSTSTWKHMVANRVVCIAACSARS